LRARANRARKDDLRTRDAGSDDSRLVRNATDPLQLKYAYYIKLILCESVCNVTIPYACRPINDITHRTIYYIGRLKIYERMETFHFFLDDPYVSKTIENLNKHFDLKYTQTHNNTCICCY